MLKMREILLQSDESVSANTTDSTKFWTTRRKLDKDICELVEKWQELWFGDLISLLIPLAHDFDSKKSRLVETLSAAEKKFITFGFSRQSATVLKFFYAFF